METFATGVRPATVSKAAPAEVYRLAKVLGVLAIAASALSHEYGATINYASTNALGTWPQIENLVPLAMFAAGLALFPKVFLWMRFCAVMPRAGGMYVWIARTLSLPASFVFSFLDWIGLTAASGFIAFVFGTFLGQALLTVGVPWGAFFLTSGGHIVLGLAMIWTIFAAHISGVRLYGRLILYLAGLIVAAAVTGIAYGFGTDPARFLQLARAQTHADLPVIPQAAHPNVAAFIAVTFVFIAAYGGLSGASALGGEARDASRTMPRGVFWGWAAAWVLYTAVAASLFHAVPWWAVIGLVHSKAAGLATVPGLISVVAPKFVGNVLVFAVAVIVGKTAIPQMLVASRLVFAWAEDHIFPEGFLHTSSQKAPDRALLLTAGLASLFLVQSTLVGWAVGITIRAFMVLVLLGCVAIGLINAKFNRRFRGVEWAARLTAGSAVAIFAALAVVVAAVLLAGGAILPKTPWFLQPLFQSLVAACIGAAVYANASRRANARGIHLAAVAHELPLE
jgi:amino acid transporter